MSSDAAPALLDHQRAFVDAVVAARRPIRMHLVAPPGSGRAVAVAGAMRAVLDSEPRPGRVLVVAWRRFQRDWQAVLRRFAALEVDVLSPAQLRRLEPVDAAAGSSWDRVSVGVVSDELLRDSEMARDAARQAWTVVVLDEAQDVPVEFCELVWDSAAVGAVIAVTSSENVASFPLQLRATSTHRFDVMLRDTQLGHARPGRQIERTSFQLTPEEREVMRRLAVVARSDGSPRSDLWSSLLRRRWESSLFAVAETLRRYLARWGQRQLDELSPALDLASRDAATVVPLDEAVVEEARAALHLIEELASDSKWDACERLLTDLTTDEAATIIVFVSYVDTAEYVAAAIAELGLRTWTVTGSQPMQERWNSIREAMGTPGVLVISIVQVEGESLGFVDDVVHYDLPMNPGRLEERFTVTELGSSRPFVRHHFLMESGTESQLEDALRAIQLPSA